ncbi:TetR/AcrR family transcriptional regulator [bacterium]|nr:TetR/AcrR family transcriptional regulator [bacterium]
MIIDKATQLFTQNGYHSTSLSQILNATGLAKGGFYFHFRSKEELGMAVLADLDNCWTHEMLPRMIQGRDAKEKLEIMLSNPGDCTCEEGFRPTILLLTLAAEMTEVHDGFSRRLREIFEGWRITIEAILEEGKLQRLFRPDVDSTAIAGIILSNVLGANLLALLNSDSSIYNQQLATLKTVLLRGMATSAACKENFGKEE